MKLYFKYLFVGLFSLSFYAVNAQNVVGYCGTQSSPISDAQLDANLAYLAIHKDELKVRDVRYVPVRFIIVQTSAGKGGINVKNAFRMLCKLNDEYANQNIQFYMKDDFKYLNNDLVNTDPQSQGAGNIMKNVKDKNALNFFFTAEIKSDNPGSILGFYSPEHDIMVIKNVEATYESQTAPHELGHFFSLRHTFYGWECQPWNVGDHGKVVTFTVAPCYGAQVELVNGSNCTTAADKVCDTPPDYNFGFGWPSDCRDYNVEVYDKNNELVRPSQNNYMSYFFGCSGYHFTQGQKDVIWADLNSAKRNYLKSTYTPPATTVSNDIEYQLPTDGQEVLKTAPILLQWAPVPNATFYIVEYSRKKGFDSNVTVTEVVKTNQYTIPASYFPSGIATGYWRVTAMNEYAICNVQTNPPMSFNLVNVVSNKVLTEVKSWQINPNVVASGHLYQLNIDMNKKSDMELNIINSAGLVSHHQKLNFTNGKHSVEIKSAKLVPGTYLVVLKNDSGMESRKLIIQ